MKNSTKPNIRKRLQIFFTEPSKTKQEFKDETDINKIVASARITGELPLDRRQQPQYGDFTSQIDYQTALNAINEAQEQFLALPSKVRARFNNDPGSLLDFVNDNRNYEEAINLGLIPKPELKAEIKPPEPVAPTEKK